MSYQAFLFLVPQSVPQLCFNNSFTLLIMKYFRCAVLQCNADVLH